MKGKALLDRGKGHVAFSAVAIPKLHMVYGLSDGFTQKIIVTFSDKKRGKSAQNMGLRPQDDGISGKDLIFYQADVSGGDLNAGADAMSCALLCSKSVRLRS